MDDNTEVSISRWLTQIEQVCTRLGIFSVNVIVDQAGDIPSLVHDLKRFKPPVDWVSLLENEPENEFIDDAPLFLQLRLDIWQHKEWLSALLRQYYSPARILVFLSANSFSLLAKHLQALTIAEWEGRKGLMRFYDTRVFPTLIESVLTEQQKHYFLAVARLWTWRNRDGHVVWLSGENEGYDFRDTVLLAIDDAQYNQLGIMSDIDEFVGEYQTKYPEFTPQLLFERLWQGSQETDGRTVLDSESFFIEYLSGIVK
ncbi:uncharacterized protein DUF4123 [Enterobacter sp. BIGb0383]|uniref:DUF4123 domain-containing protein n=1 Tax=unclassified Enterobacter TaxID=2608935 RepID=UPI000FBF4ADD|nr:MULTISPECIES: DUF4123 domain-containing protein [unclassified Enterobacter]ROP61537.1 uncharacterized protein DUF4123 [Enterobacter sp. BIGb0383]ROS11698.1 uncharacterized protein DUF4123 [Enterobacter sp. BIGb0359]